MQLLLLAIIKPWYLDLVLVRVLLCSYLFIYLVLKHTVRSTDCSSSW